ncbi:MAG: calcium-translocating P-type ATPase, SERCA-type [Candidatus Undinarchaeales archaeon]
MNYYQKSVSESLEELNAKKAGLSSTDAEKRLEEYGRNRLEEREKIRPIEIFIRQFKSFLIFILIAAAIISGFLGIFTGSSEHFIDMAVIIIIIVLNAVLGFFQEYKAEKSLEALKKYATPKAKVIRNGERQLINSEELVPGDIIVLSTGDKVPADARLIESIHFHSDESALTGESIPVAKATAKIEGEDIIPGEQKNMVFAGTTITQGRGKAVVTETGMDTEMGEIAELVQEPTEKMTPLQKRLALIGKKLGFAIISIAILVFALGLFRGEELINMFLVAVSLAVAAVPEGLPAVVTVTLAFGLMSMAKSNALVRKLPAVETLGSTTIICSDKTGTLTMNEMTARELYLDKKKIEISGEGYAPEGKFKYEDSEVSGKLKKHLNLFAQAAALCNDSELVRRDGEWTIIGDPTEGAFRVLAEKFGLKQHRLESEFKRIEEVEFTSKRKKMTTVHKIDEGRVAYMKGAPEVVLENCSHVYENGKRRKLKKADKERFLNKMREMGEDALRVLGVAYRDVPKRLNITNEKSLEQNFTFLGLAGMIDPPRSEVKEAVRKARKAGIRSVMITGDYKVTAEAVAKEVGIIEKKSNALTGEDLEKMSDEELFKQVKNVSVYARVSPSHKVRILNALKKRGEVVAMTGDGVNDAPALKKSDIGVAMGIKGTDVSKEAADMVLEDDNYATIVKAVEKGRGIFDNISKFINYLLTSNAGEILVIFIATLIGLPLPLIAVQILWINLLTDGLPAVSLSVDPHDPDIMKRKPRDPEEGIITNEMVFDIIFVGALMCIGTLFLFNHALSGGANIVYARSIALAVLVVLEVVRLQMVREKYNIGVFSNKWLILAVISSIGFLLAILYIPQLQILFKTAPIKLFDWLKITGITIAVFISVQVTIIIKRHLKEK